MAHTDVGLGCMIEDFADFINRLHATAQPVMACIETGYCLLIVYAMVSTYILALMNVFREPEAPILLVLMRRFASAGIAFMVWYLPTQSMSFYFVCIFASLAVMKRNGLHQL